MSEPIIFKLSQSMTTHKGEVRELQLNQVKLGTFVRYGSPFRTVTRDTVDGKSTSFEYDYKSILGFLADATGIDVLLLQNGISGSDVLPLSQAIVTLVTQSPN